MWGVAGFYDILEPYPLLFLSFSSTLASYKKAKVILLIKT